MMVRYDWSERTVGFVMALVGLCSMIVQGGLIGPTVRRLARAGRCSSVWPSVSRASQAFALSIGAGAIVYLPGAPFLLSALMLAAAILVALCTTNVRARNA